MVPVLLACSGKLLITGSGTSGTVQGAPRTSFRWAGTPAFYLSPNDGLRGSLGVLRKNDVVIAISKGGASEELNQFCSRAGALAAAVIVIPPRQNPNSLIWPIMSCSFAFRPNQISVLLWPQEVPWRPPHCLMPLWKLHGLPADIPGVISFLRIRPERLVRTPNKHFIGLTRRRRNDSTHFCGRRRLFYAVQHSSFAPTR